MNAYVSKEELALLSPNRISFPEHYADARAASKPASVAARIASWLERRTVMNELRSMTDRELADIGIARQDIPHVFTRRLR